MDIKKSFRDKWEKNKDLVFSESLSEDSYAFRWIIERNGFQDSSHLQTFLKKKKRILDAGCGNGRVTALLRKYSPPAGTEIIGIDLVSADIAEQNLKKYGLYNNIKFYPKDLLDDLTDLGTFDFIYCQEVLHHTPSPRDGFLNLCKRLSENGGIAVYVYKKKGPMREFADEYIRDKISGLSYEEAMSVCGQITELGKVLSESGIKVKVPQVDILDIKEGEYDLQRFIYHFFLKCFWNTELTVNDNTVINYDWYHPQICSKHTVEEVREWFEAAGLTIIYEFVDFYGITMRGQK